MLPVHSDHDDDGGGGGGGGGDTLHTYKHCRCRLQTYTTYIQTLTRENQVYTFQ